MKLVVVSRTRQHETDGLGCRGSSVRGWRRVGRTYGQRQGCVRLMENTKWTKEGQYKTEMD